MRPIILVLLFCVIYSYSRVIPDSDCEDDWDTSREYEWRERERERTRRPIRRDPECPTGWARFTRQKGEWCMQVFSGNIYQKDAEKQCKALGATLSGIENTNEQQFIMTRSRPFVVSAGLGVGAIWIGAHRAQDCYYVGMNQNGCNAVNSFKWTDGMTSGGAGFTWRVEQPDNNYRRQACVVMFVKHNGDTRAPTKYAFVTGSLDDRECDDRPGDVQGYVCGMKPRYYKVAKSNELREAKLRN